MQKLSYKNVPDNFVFEYALSVKELTRIRKEMRGFNPETPEQHEWLKRKLKEYHRLFIKISKFNNKIVKK